MCPHPVAECRADRRQELNGIVEFLVDAAEAGDCDRIAFDSGW